MESDNLTSSGIDRSDAAVPNQVDLGELLHEIDKIRGTLDPNEQRACDELVSLLAERNLTADQLKAVYMMGNLVAQATSAVFVSAIKSLGSATSRGARQLTAECSATMKYRADKCSTYAAMQNAVNLAHREDPHASHAKLCRAIAPEFGCSPRTIARRTEFPTKA